MRIEHVAMYVNDLEKVKDFFVRYFDARADEHFHSGELGFSSYFLTFDEGTRLELMKRTEMENPPKTLRRTGFVHVAFSVGSREKVDALTQQLKADGYSVISGPRVTADGYYESCILDVEGNQIEITV